METPAETLKTGADARRRNLIILLAALAILLNGVSNFVSSARKANELIPVGSPLPEFSLKQSGNSAFSTSAFKGKPAMYYFFANWCPCSHESVPFLRQVMADNAQSGVTMVGVGIQDTPAELESFVKRHKMTTPVGISGGNDMANTLGVRTTPTTLFVDADGVVRFIHIGKIERYDQIAKGVEAIAGKPATPASGQAAQRRVA